METRKRIASDLVSYCVKAVFKLIVLTEMCSGIKMFNIKTDLQRSSAVTYI